jgi:hypothetical protein
MINGSAILQTRVCSGAETTLRRAGATDSTVVWWDTRHDISDGFYRSIHAQRVFGH